MFFSNTKDTKNDQNEQHPSVMVHLIFKPPIPKCSERNIIIEVRWMINQAYKDRYGRNRKGVNFDQNQGGTKISLAVFYMFSASPFTSYR